MIKQYSEKPYRILFLGETYRADAQTWIKGIEKVSGLKIETMEVDPTGSRILRMLKFLRFWLNILRIKKNEYDFVLAERATSYGFFSLFVPAKVHVVAQQGITDAYPETGFSGIYKRYLQKKVYQKVDLIHAWGEVMVPAMLQSNADPAKILVMPKGMDLTKYAFYDPFKRVINQHAIVTRSLTDVYHHEVILDSVAILKSRKIVIYLTVVGDGNLMEDLKSKSKSLGIQDLVDFKGRISNDALPPLLQRSSIYISVPETEGVSASLFEAMASGCFPIVTDLPGTRAFIRNNENGILIPVNDANALADAIQKFLESAEEYFPAINQNRRYIENIVNLERNMKVIFAKYLEILKSKTEVTN
ncbi:glycosyltransferase [Algoriphagus aestuarii]|nr:glycosyltransferase [Algoriphagus aestuarii]